MPLLLFGRNAEAVIGVPWRRACTCQAVCIDGGIALAILTAAFHSVVPSCLIGEGLVCGWMLSATSLHMFFLNFRRNIISRTLHAIIAWSIAVFTGARIVRSIVKGMGALLTT